MYGLKIYSSKMPRLDGPALREDCVGRRSQETRGLHHNPRVHTGKCFDAAMPIYPCCLVGRGTTSLALCQKSNGVDCKQPPEHQAHSRPNTYNGIYDFYDFSQFYRQS